MFEGGGWSSMKTLQTEDPKKSKLYALMVAIWASLSLFLTADLQNDIFDDFNSIQTALLWMILIIAPLLSLLWIWLFETSPWQRIPIIGILLPGAVTSLIAFNDRQTDDWFLLPIIWSGVALISAYLLANKRSLKEVLGTEVKKSPSNRSIQIDHVHYLHQLDEQLSIGLPSVMRVRSYFLEEMPKVIFALAKPEKGKSPFKFPSNTPFSNDQIASFMGEKLATELTYLCTIAFLDRVCGPDFRYTKQYRALKEFFLALEPSHDAKALGSEDPNLKMDAIVTASDLDAAISSLDSQTAKKPDDISASNVTVSLAGLRHIILSGLVPKEQMNEDEIGKMVYAAMVRTREMFRNRTTTL